MVNYNIEIYYISYIFETMTNAIVKKISTGTVRRLFYQMIVRFYGADRR